MPYGYIITFRTYGTWLHGDARGSHDRRHRTYGAPSIAENRQWNSHLHERLEREPVTLTIAQRALVDEAVRDTVAWRDWILHAVNVRTNHVHVVIWARCKPESVVGALKANATRMLRESKLWNSDFSPWASGSSTRYLWDDYAIRCAIEYVLHRQ